MSESIWQRLPLPTAWLEGARIEPNWNKIPITEDDTMSSKQKTSDRKRVNMSLPPESYKKLVEHAEGAGVPPTRLASLIVAAVLDFELRPATFPSKSEDDSTD